jgi:glucokinase
MYRIGIDLGGTNIAYGLVDAAGNLIKKRSVATDRGASAEELTEFMAKRTLEFIDDCGIKRSDV